MASDEDFWGDEAAGIFPMARDTCRFLVQLRSRQVYQEYTYGTIGGKMEWGEESEETALREFDEETGYKGDIELTPAFVYEVPDVFRYHNFLGIVDREFEPTITWESVGYKWLELDDVKRLDNLHFGLEALLEESSELIEDARSFCLRKQV